MKKISIHRLLSMEVSNSIGIYAFKELKVNKEFRNLDVLKSFCSLTRQINDTDQEGGSEIIEVKVDDIVVKYLPQLIAKYIFDEISEYEEPNFEWVMEMMSIHDQLTDDSNYDAVQDVKDVVHKTAPEVTTPEITVPEVREDYKNKDVIEKLNADLEDNEMDEPEEQEEEEEINESSSWEDMSEEELELF